VGLNSLTLYVYTPELYPTRMRALGSSTSTAFLRIASIIGPYVVGVVVAGADIKWLFLIFAVVALIGAVIVGVFAQETKGKALEELCP
jgi:MFS transporter, putative metabolite:H+ symporter